MGCKQICSTATLGDALYSLNIAAFYTLAQMCMNGWMMTAPDGDHFLVDNSSFLMKAPLVGSVAFWRVYASKAEGQR